MNDKELRLTRFIMSESYMRDGTYKGKVEFKNNSFAFSVNIDNNLCLAILALIPNQIREAKSLLADKLEELVKPEILTANKK